MASSEMDGAAIASRGRFTSLSDIAQAIAAGAVGRPRPGPAYLAAISGVDGSGKTHLSRIIADRTEALGLRVALIGIDPWHNPQPIRFGGATDDPGRHFYYYVIRFADLFEQLVEPLVARRSIRLETKGIRTDRDVWDDFVYAFDDIDVVLLEGILLFQPALVDRYDLRIWIECSFETAVRRALDRNVENLPEAQLREDYARIYHAAQRLHLTKDAPQTRAELVVVNEGAEAAAAGFEAGG